MKNLIGQSIGRYRIIEPLGEGGMAEVYLAFDGRLECNVAIKFIRINRLSSDANSISLKRFEREAKAVASLSHPNIIKVMDYGEYEETPYLVMEHVTGGSLKKRMGKPMPCDEAVKIITPIARALAYAHNHNIIHRDVKPSNILINEFDEPLLIDFGIAKLIDNTDGQTLTSVGMGMGTPEYMAPEQWIGKFSPAVDVYSLGAILYELITGRKPFTASTPAELLLKTMNDPLPRPGLFVRNLPEKIEAILLKSLAKKPEDRFQSMDEMALALEEFTQDPYTPARLPFENSSTSQDSETVDFQVTNKKASRKTMIWIGLGSLLVIGMGAIFLPKVLHAKATPLPVTATSLVAATSLATDAATPEPAITNSPTETMAPIPTQITSAVISIDNVQSLEMEKLVSKGPVTKIAFSPDGDTIAMAVGGDVTLFDGFTLEELRTIKNATSIMDITFSVDGNMIAASFDNQTIKLWNTADGSLEQTLLSQSTAIYSLDFSPDGNTLASASSVGSIDIWNISDGAIIQTLPDRANSYPIIQYSPDGTLLASGSSDGLLRVFRVSDGALLNTVSGDSNNLNGIAFSPDGQYIASSGTTFTRLWFADDGRLVITLDSQPKTMGAVAFSPDGKILAAGASDGMIHLWSVDDYSLLTTLSGHTSDINTLAFSPQGNLFLSGSADGTMRVWTVTQ